MFDYRELLVKYITHVGNCEGVTYLSSDWNKTLSELFTAEEVEELRKLDEESSKYVC